MESDKENSYLDEFILEITSVGNALKVVAIDPKTSIEVVLIVPKNTNPEYIKALARNKLLYVLNKNN
jgi:hypothetical protein